MVKSFKKKRGFLRNFGLLQSKKMSVFLRNFRILQNKKTGIFLRNFRIPTKEVTDMRTSKKEEVAVFDETLTRSNQLILSRYSATLMENKMMALALKRVRPNEEGNPTVTFTTDEIRHLTNTRGNGFYDLLKKAAAGLMNKMIYMEDEGSHSFVFINLVHKAEFREGIFTVVFTAECKKYLYGLKSNFTSIPLTTLFSFKNNYAYRLYEILKVRAYEIKKAGQALEITYPLSDLKLQLNCVNTEDTKVKMELMKPHPDYDKIVNTLNTEKKLKDWYEFRRWVLDKAVKEINEITDLLVKYEPIRTGRGGKTTGVRFFLQKKETIDIVAEDMSISQKGRGQKALIEEVRSIMDAVKLSKKDCLSLLEASQEDLDKIREAYSLAKKQVDIKNIVGWMICAIKEGYAKPIQVMEGSQANAEGYHRIRENLKENKEERAAKLWEKHQRHEKFNDFVAYIQSSKDVAFYFYDKTRSAEEKNQDFIQWMKS